jgi:hypothetical protein
VQGRLREEPLSAVVRSECAHCGRRMHIEVDSELRCRAREQGAAPLVFEPQINWATFKEPNIIHAY